VGGEAEAIMEKQNEELGPTEQQLEPKYIENVEREFKETFRRRGPKPTKLSALPYKNAPLSTYDLVMQQVRFEEQFFPHIEIKHPEEAMRKELPSQKWNPVGRNWFLGNITKFALSTIA
jgi:hypothetical protein